MPLTSSEPTARLPMMVAAMIPALTGRWDVSEYSRVSGREGCISDGFCLSSPNYLLYSAMLCMLNNLLYH